MKYLILALTGCMILVGCQQETDTTAPADTLSLEITTQMETNGETIKELGDVDMTITVPGILEWGPPVFSGADQEILPGEIVPVYAQNKTRITYTHNQNYVQYITSATALDRYGMDVFKQYDETFFEKKALVLVCETVTSGSLQVSIDQIVQQDSQITVVLSRELPGDAGTSDMATWLIWAEVDAGRNGYTWVLHNPMLKSEMSSTH